MQKYKLDIISKEIKNPLVQRGLVSVYVIHPFLQRVVDFGFSHKYGTINELVKLINKQENIIMYLYYTAESKYFSVNINKVDNTESMFLVGAVTCSKRVVRTLWHELQRAKKQEVIDKIVNVIENEIKIMNDWFITGLFHVDIYRDDDLIKSLSSIYARNDEELFEKIELLSELPNIKEIIKNHLDGKEN